MKTLLYIIALASIIATLTPFLLYSLFRLNKNMVLRKWRKNITPGMQLRINDGQSEYTATVVSVNGNWLRVISPSGNTAAYTITCTYPIPSLNTPSSSQQ